SYSLEFAITVAQRYIQFSEPQLEHDKFPAEEMANVRLASQFAQNTTRLSSPRLTWICGFLPHFNQNCFFMIIVLAFRSPCYARVSVSYRLRQCGVRALR